MDVEFFINGSILFIYISMRTGTFKCRRSIWRADGWAHNAWMIKKTRGDLLAKTGFHWNMLTSSDICVTHTRSTAEHEVYHTTCQFTE